MAGIYGPIEHTYCQPFADAFASSATFRDWFLQRIGLTQWAGRCRPLAAEQAARRPSAKFWWKNYYCHESRCSCPLLSGREIDILLICQRDDGQRLAIHIECKQPSDRFSPDQAAGYPRRAECWKLEGKGPKTLLRHDAAVTVLLCSRAGQHSNAELSFFGSIIFFDEVAALVDPYPALH